MNYATAPKPAHVIQEPRYIVLFWPTPGAIPNANGHTLHNTLTLEHDARQYIATASTALASIPGDGTIQVDLQIGNRPRRSLLTSAPAPRYSAPRFKEFCKGILS